MTCKVFMIVIDPNGLAYVVFVYIFQNGERSPLILMVMQSLSVPFQGFVNAVVYKQFPGLSCFRLGLRGNDVRYNFLENSGTYQR